MRRSDAFSLLIPAALAFAALCAPGVGEVRAMASAADDRPTVFSSEPNHTWGTSPSEDPNEAGRDKAGRVLALAEANGKVFLGGEFAGVMPPGMSTKDARTNPTPVVRRPYLAALDVNTGALLDWDVHPDGPVLSLAVSADGKRLYLVVLDAATAKPTAWQPTLDTPRPVFGLGLWPADGKTIFAAAGGPGGAVEAFTPGGSSTPRWIHKVDGDGTDVVATTQRLYFVGHYDYVLGKNTTCGGTSCTGGNAGDEPNRHIAAFDPRNGAHDRSFTAQFNTPQGPQVALIGAHHLYVGGDFTEADFTAHPGFAQFAALG